MRTMYTMILSLAASLAAGADENDGDHGIESLIECSCTGHQKGHKRGFSGLKRSSYRHWELLHEGGLQVRAQEIGGVYNVRKDRIRTEKGTWMDAGAEYENLNVFKRGAERADGNWFSDHVGMVHYFHIAPFGDLKTKGYFGSDGFGTEGLTFSLPDDLPDAIDNNKYLAWNSWDEDESHPHQGIGTLRHKLRSHTMLKDISNGYSAGHIQPYLNATQVIRNIGSLEKGFGSITYKHHESSIVNWEVGASGKFTKKGPEGGVNIGVGGKFEIDTEHQWARADAVADACGSATSRVEAQVDSRIGLDIETNDMVAAWEMSITTDEIRLDTYHQDNETSETPSAESSSIRAEKSSTSSKGFSRYSQNSNVRQK